MSRRDRCDDCRQTCVCRGRECECMTWTVDPPAPMALRCYDCTDKMETVH